MKTFFKSKTFYILVAILAVLVIIFVGIYLFKKNIGSINIPSQAPFDLSNSVAIKTGNVSSLPSFVLPAGFSLNIFAKNVPGARVIEVDPKGNILVSETDAGKIVALLDTNGDGFADLQKVLASGLDKPHGMAVNCDNSKCFLYVAEQDMLSRFPYDADTISLGQKEKLMAISSLPTDRHFTRSLLFLPPPNQDTLLVSVGSSCDACNEKVSDHAVILSYNITTGKKEIYAKGLRNATFMTLNPQNGKVYATEMGRDYLGDNVPPDEINIIEEKNNQPQNYGWPICYGKNIHDNQFDKNTYVRNPCMEPFEIPSFIDLQAHSAPLGLAFIPTSGGWPEEYQGDLLVAYHGSWNRSTPTGYKIVLIKMNGAGEYIDTEDFITGWLTKNGEKIGRPVDIKVLPGGVAYISDDSSGLIYKLSVNK